MKLLLDQGLPRGAAAHLARRGHDAVHVGDLGMARATDAQVLDRARLEGRTVVTLDADFHAILALSGARAPSTIRIRIEGLRSEALAHLVDDVVLACIQDLAAGALVVVDEHRIRVRLLPVVHP